MDKMEDIVGQEEIVQFFRRSIRQNKISHAILLHGEKHSGKHFMARIFAAALCCERGGESPCGECRSCRMAAGNNHPDIVTVQHEKPTSFGVKEIRQGLVDDIAIRPYQADRKVYLIPDASLLTTEAQNAVLKTLEEPPSYAVMILLADNREVLLPTILSRCVSLAVKPVPDALIRGILSKEGSLSGEDMDLSLAFGRGRIGRAKLIALGGEFQEQLKESIRLLSHAGSLSSTEELAFLKLISENKENAGDFLDLFRSWFRDVLLYKATGDGEALTFLNGRREIMRQSEKLTYSSLREILDGIEETGEALKAGVSGPLSFELLIDRINEKLSGGGHPLPG